MANGTVKRINQDKGFGFIKGEDGLEYFFHRSAVQGTGYDRLSEGQKVTFEIETSPKGPRASVVTPA